MHQYPFFGLQTDFTVVIFKKRQLVSSKVAGWLG